MLKNIKEYSNLEIATYFHIPIPPSDKSLDGPKTDSALPGIMFNFLLSYYPME